MCSVFILYEIKMENPPPPPKKFFFGEIGNFLSGVGEKNILFGIGNGAEFRPQNQVIESLAMTHPPHRISASGDGNELGGSFSCCDPMRQYIQVIFSKRAISCYTT